MSETTISCNISTDISYIWTRLNRRWLVAGLLAGWGAGLMMAVAAAVLTGNFFYPFRLVGAAVLGPQALSFNSSLGVLTGFALHFGLSGFFGVVFAQCVWEHSRKRALLLLGMLASLVVWLFWSMMFMPSFDEPLFFTLPKLVSLALHLIFGVVFGTLITFIRSRIPHEVSGSS